MFHNFIVAEESVFNWGNQDWCSGGLRYLRLDLRDLEASRNHGNLKVSLFNCNSSRSKHTDLGIVYSEDQAKQAKNQQNSALCETISICYGGRWQ